MTLPYPIPRQNRQSDIFLGDGTKVYGPFDFKIFDVLDVEVWTKASGEAGFALQPSVLVEKLSDDPFDDFTVTFPANQPVTTEIVVRSARLDDRAAGVVSGTQISPNALEKEFSKISTEVQELRRDVGRAVKSDFGTPALTVVDDIADGHTLILNEGFLEQGPDLTTILAAEGYANSAHEDAERAEEAADRAEDYADFARNNWVNNGPFAGTGAQHDYALTIDPGSANNMFVVVGGVSQLISQGAYSLVYSGGDPFIRINVPAGVPFEVRISNAIPVGAPPDGSVTTPKLGNGSVTTVKLDDKAATYVKMQDISATLRLLGRASAGAGVIEEMTPAQLRDLFLPSGCVIQSFYVANFLSTAIASVIPADDTVPLVTEGTLYTFLDITPIASGNFLDVEFNSTVCTSIATSTTVAMFIGSTCIAAKVISTAANVIQNLSMKFRMAVGANAGVLTRINVRVGSGGTLRMNGTDSARLLGGTQSANFIVSEIKG